MQKNETRRDWGYLDMKLFYDDILVSDCTGIIITIQKLTIQYIFFLINFDERDFKEENGLVCFDYNKFRLVG